MSLNKENDFRLNAPRQPSSQPLGISNFQSYNNKLATERNSNFIQKSPVSRVRNPFSPTRGQADKDHFPGLDSFFEHEENNNEWHSFKSIDSSGILRWSIDELANLMPINIDDKSVELQSSPGSNFRTTPTKTSVTITDEKPSTEPFAFTLSPVSTVPKVPFNAGRAHGSPLKRGKSLMQLSIQKKLQKKQIQTRDAACQTDLVVPKGFTLALQPIQSVSPVIGHASSLFNPANTTTTTAARPQLRLSPPQVSPIRRLSEHFTTPTSGHSIRFSSPGSIHTSASPPSTRPASVFGLVSNGPDEETHTMARLKQQVEEWRLDLNSRMLATSKNHQHHRKSVGTRNIEIHRESLL